MGKNKINSKPLLLQIAELGVPVIRQKAKNVENITDPFIQNLIDDMIATVKEVNGVGIAAPQVYQPLRIFIIASYPNPRYPKAPRVRPFAVINPAIISKSKEMEKDWSGCLSIPGIRGKTPRNTSLKAVYYDRNGKKIERTFKGFLSKIFQHEYDHLEGKVFIDRLGSMADLITEKEYQRLMKKITKTQKNR